MTRAFLAAIVLSVLLAGSAVAQEQGASIEATGFGTATAPPQTAYLQVLLGSSASFGFAPVEMSPGTPEAGFSSMGSMGMVTLSDEQLDPVVAAISATGIGNDAIATTVPAYSNMFGPGGPEIAEIRVTLDQPSSGDLIDLVAAVRTVAQQSGLTVLFVGARYVAADCASLAQEARVAAIADATARAEGMAEGLGVTLGELTKATESPYYGPTGVDPCALTGTSEGYGAYGPGSEPAFDANATEVAVTVQVTLSYAIAPAA